MVVLPVGVGSPACVLNTWETPIHTDGGGAEEREERPNSYTGNTTINGGALLEIASHPATSPVIVMMVLFLASRPAGSAHFSPTSLALGSSAGAVLKLGLSSQTQAPLTPVTLALTGSNAVILSGGFAPGNSYPVLSYTTLTGAGTLNFIIPKGVTGTVTLAAKHLYAECDGGCSDDLDRGGEGTWTLTPRPTGVSTAWPATIGRKPGAV